MSDDGPDQYAPTSPIALIAFGVVVGAIGVILLSVEFENPPPVWIGQLLLGLGGVMSTVGAVAAGVELALVRHEWRERKLNQ